MSTKFARVMRGLVIACISLLVTATAHITGGGQIGEVGFVLALTFSVLVSIALTGRSVSRLRTAVSVVLSQGAFHLLFGIGAGYQAEIATRPGMQMSGMGDLSGSMLTPSATSTAPIATMPDSGWMWAAHGTAAVLTIVALAWGEKTFWRLTDRLAIALTRVFSSPEPIAIPRRQLPSVVTETDHPGARFLLAGLRHRGPPAAFASS
jgi:hypothetical protein